MSNFCQPGIISKLSRIEEKKFDGYMDSKILMYQFTYRFENCNFKEGNSNGLNYFQVGKKSLTLCRNP